MTVSTPIQPNFTGMSAAVYKAALDAMTASLSQSAGMYAPHEATPVAMTVKVDAGRFVKPDYTLVTNAQQTATITTAHATLPRIDRVVVDGVTGTVSVIAGTPNASPTAPAITAGKLPVCQVYVAATVTTISNSVITDERAFMANFPALLAAANTWTADQTISTTDPQLTLIETDAAADNKRWDVIASGEALSIRAVNDAVSVTTDVVTVQRTGTTVDSVTVGGSLVVLTGGQLKFPATQVPSSDANVLDDYEEGTWYPSLGGTSTLSYIDAYYTKIGKLVNVVGAIIVNTIGTGSPSTISGLPFPCYDGPGSGSVSIYSGLTVSPIMLTCKVDATTSSIVLAGLTAAAASITTPFSCLGNGSIISFNITYRTNN